MEVSTSFRPAGALDVRTALLPYRGVWTERQAGHLLRRAGFGGSQDDVARLVSLGMERAVDSLMDLSAGSGMAQQPEGTLGWGKGERRQTYVSMAGWWLNRMLATPCPLQEKMALFYHGHFTSAVFQKGVRPLEMVDQINLYRRLALGDIRDLTHRVVRDPAMMRYLDTVSDSKQHPNENFARELMELFTMGHGSGYTEEDVRQAARAFTGYTLRGGRYAERGQFVFMPRRHDDGVKTFLRRAGNLNAGDIVEIIYQQAATPKFLAGKLLEFFLYWDPEPELVEAYGRLLEGNRWQVSALMSTLLRSRLFYSGRAYRALVKSPAEFVIGTLQLVKRTTLQEPAPVVASMRRMGQILFLPPNVAGWSAGAAWINSATMLARQNFADAVAMTPMASDPAEYVRDTATMDPSKLAAGIVDLVVQGDVSAAQRARIASYLAGPQESAGRMNLNGENLQQRVRGAVYLAMATPAYQLA
ncbi:MAG: DUF1800 domain-containing protein [bacterium]|nr:DUF1800 domain-containing protein [bacterium]